MSKTAPVIEMQDTRDGDACDKVIVSRGKLNELVDARREAEALARENAILREINRRIMLNVRIGSGK